VFFSLAPDIIIHHLDYEGPERPYYRPAPYALIAYLRLGIATARFWALSVCSDD
jgi:hypothetical protein